jgi:hypothetical protein
MTCEQTRSEDVSSLEEFEKLSGCPEDLFEWIVGDENEPFHYLSWKPNGRAPYRCKQCHIPQWEARQRPKKDHVCWLAPCTSWKNCLGNHYQGSALLRFFFFCVVSDI